MAHYIAEQITAAEAAGDDDRSAREHAAAESILALWQRRAGLPGDRPPMHSFQRVFLALDRLAEPQDPWRFYHSFPEEAEPGPEDLISSTLLRVALDLEYNAREIVRALIAEAATTALNSEARWVRMSEGLADDEERKAIRFLEHISQPVEQGDGDPEAVEPLERAQARLTRTIEQLTTISDAIAEVRRHQEA